MRTTPMGRLLCEGVLYGVRLWPMEVSVTGLIWIFPKAYPLLVLPDEASSY